MNETMGQIIRRLRRERGMTQEELAEILGVTFQAVSKWENDTGMPDISQVVPLAHVFGVPTDTILCVGETAPNVDAMQIYTNAMQNTRYGVVETYLSAFNKLKEGLDGKYPTNLLLLNAASGLGLSLVLPENGWMYAGKDAGQISRDTERYTNRIISCSHFPSDILSARQRLVYLYSARGEFDRAESEAYKFPVRSDLTLEANLARVNEQRAEYGKVITELCTDIDYTLQHIEDDVARLGQAYMKENRLEEAAQVYEIFFDMIKAIYRDECPWPYHDFDSGDCYFLLAEVYLKQNKPERALDTLEEAIRYAERVEQYRKEVHDSAAEGMFHRSPLLQESEIAHDVEIALLNSPNRWNKLRDKLTDPRFDALKDEERYQYLLTRMKI